MGVEIFAPFAETGKKPNRLYDPYYIRSFKLPHGETNSYGALIEHADGTRILYLTDFEYCPFTFTNWNVNHILIECNYQPEFVNLDAANKEHKLRGHCSLQTCADFVKANKTDALKTVTLIHAGLSTLNPNDCTDTIQNIVGDKVKVYFARNGMEIEL